MNPYVIDRVESADGKVVEQFMPSAYGKLMSADEAETLTNFMVAVVNEGTSPSLQSDSYQVAGKTGSAEFSSNKDESHAWFVGFAPADNPGDCDQYHIRERRPRRFRGDAGRKGDL